MIVQEGRTQSKFSAYINKNGDPEITVNVALDYLSFSSSTDYKSSHA